MAWTLAAPAADVPVGKSKIVTIGTKQIGLFNDGGTYHAVLNFCPHMGAPLCVGGRITSVVTSDSPGEVRLDTTRRAIRCPWHHWEFDLATGKAIANTREKIKTYPIEQRGADLWIDV